MGRPRCPAIECRNRVTEAQVLCEDHFALTPAPVRAALRAAKGDKTSQAWRNAAKAAVDAVNARVRIQHEEEDMARSARDEARAAAVLQRPRKIASNEKMDDNEK